MIRKMDTADSEETQCMGEEIKVYITVGILLVGAVLTVIAGIGSGTTVYQNDGTAIDFEL